MIIRNYYKIKVYKNISMKTKIISPVKKIKQKKKVKSPVNKSLDKYREFISGKKDTIQSKDKKVIHVKRKRFSPKVKKKDIRDINDIEQKLLEIKDTKIKAPTQNISIDPKVKEKKETDVPAKVPAKVAAKVAAKVEKKVPAKVEKKVPAKVEKKVPVKVTSLSIKKPSRSNSRSLGRKKTRGRKISIKSRVFNEKDVKQVESKIKEIRGKKADDIKKELKEQGIKVSGKSNRLLKDIYLYSKLSNINIQHEK